MPEHYRIRIMPRAASDLMAICSFIELHSPQNAISAARDRLTVPDTLAPTNKVSQIAGNSNEAEARRVNITLRRIKICENRLPAIADPSAPYVVSSVDRHILEATWQISKSFCGNSS